MQKQKLIILLLLLLRSPIAYSQKDFSNYMFSNIDSFARSVVYENDIYKLTTQLTANYFNEVEKARSIFIWITENISYDYKFVNKGKEIKSPSCDESKDCSIKLKDWENNYINKVLEKKKGICDGYSRLFKRMCEIAGLKCEIISGRARTEPYQVGNPTSVNHSWNAILIDSSYYFLDATWAAGFCTKDEETEKLVKFQKQYNNYYWLTPFKKLVRNHYPENGRWVYEENYPKEKFFQNPYYAHGVIESIDLISPTSGVIDAKKGDTISFKFTYPNSIQNIQINTNGFRNPPIYTVKKITKKHSKLELDTFALKKQRYIQFKHTDNLYEFSYIMTDNSIYYVDILFDYKQVMRFKIKNN